MVSIKRTGLVFFIICGILEFIVLASTGGATETGSAWYEASVLFVFNYLSNRLLQLTSWVKLREVFQVLGYPVIGFVLVTQCMSGKGQGRDILPALRSLGPVPSPPREPEKGKGLFERKGKVARLPPATLTPPPSERLAEESSSVAVAFPTRTMSSDDRTLVNLLARMGEVQRVMMAQHGEFQVSLSGVLKSHDDQLAAQVVTQQNMVQQMGEFHQVVGDVLASQVESQRLMSEQLSHAGAAGCSSDPGTRTCQGRSRAAQTKGV